MMQTDVQPLSGSRLPVVVIAGRPNVGKSALFNRLAGRRLAIVHEESGVTRDRVAAPAAWEGRRFELVDTGGILAAGREASSDAIAAAVGRQTGVALEDADAVIFVTDVERGPAGMDQEVARLLRREGKPVFVACNKCDTEARDSGAVSCAEFGYPVFPVSALHNRGIAELMAAVTGALPPGGTEPEPIPLRVALAGRPNVGKSSLMNAVLKRDRVIVSERPGTTRDSIDIAFTAGEGASVRRYLLTDTAGIRQAGKVDTAVEKFSLIRAEASIRQCHLAVLLLDAEQGPTLQDKKIASLIQSYHRGCIVAINKWDLAMGKVKERAYAEAFRRLVPFLDFAPLLFVSARTGFQVRTVIEAIDQVAASVQATLPTGLLNRTLIEAYERVTPPSVGGKRLKIYYATQVGVDPVRVALFVNDPRCWVPAYETYLIKAIRARFGLEGAPVLLMGKPKRGHGEGEGARDRGGQNRA